MPDGKSPPRAGGAGPIGQAKTGPLFRANSVMVLTLNYKRDLHKYGNDRHDIRTDYSILAHSSTAGLSKLHVQPSINVQILGLLTNQGSKGVI